MESFLNEITIETKRIAPNAVAFSCIDVGSNSGLLFFRFFFPTERPIISQCKRLFCVKIANTFFSLFVSRMYLKRVAKRLHWNKKRSSLTKLLMVRKKRWVNFQWRKSKYSSVCDFWTPCNNIRYICEWSAKDTKQIVKLCDVPCAYFFLFVVFSCFVYSL